MSIKDDVKAAINEFGDSALERFVLNNNGTSKLKPLPELFAHDVSVYGDDAYLMWEIYMRPCSFRSESGWQTMNGNQYEQIAGDVIRRKTSAALPFDIERAKAGDAVEWFGGKEWISADTDVACWTYGVNSNRKDLRMKYPQADKNDKKKR